MENKLSERSISVAIPTRNRPELLARAIESLITQPCNNLEIIVADNASIADLAPLHSRYAGAGIRWFRHERDIGMVGNWNFCLEQASGELFLMLSDDDQLWPGALAWLSGQFADDRVRLAYVRCQLVDEKMQPRKLVQVCPARESGDSFIRAFLDRKRPCFPSGAMFRIAAAREAGGYPAIGTATDFALHLLVTSGGEVVYNPEPLCNYCLHPHALSGTGAALDTIHDLVAWSLQPGTVQYAYRKEIYAYSVKFIFRWGLARWTQGGAADLSLALQHLSRYPDEIARAAILKCLDTPIFRTLGKLASLVKVEKL